MRDESEVDSYKTMLSYCIPTFASLPELRESEDHDLGIKVCVCAPAASHRPSAYVAFTVIRLRRRLSRL